jgi:hypothetical protein
VPTPEMKLPFDGLRGMARTRHGRTRRRGLWERANGGGAAEGGEKKESTEP